MNANTIPVPDNAIAQGDSTVMNLCPRTTVILSTAELVLSMASEVCITGCNNKIPEKKHGLTVKYTAVIVLIELNMSFYHFGIVLFIYFKFPCLLIYLFNYLAESECYSN